jgi:endogenous inhibitor of DNA gyrase (YacG/DUF329 family)
MSDPHPAGDAAVPARQVRCPGCGGPARYAADNPWRPFCSERCRGADLGAWASERYRVAATPPADEGEPEA